MTMNSESKRRVEKDPKLKQDDLIVITGAGGFIAGNLARHFRKQGFTRIRAVDKKPLYEWYLQVPGVESLSLDCSIESNCQRVCEGPSRFTTWRPIWAAWVSSSGSASIAFAPS